MSQSTGDSGPASVTAEFSIGDGILLREQSRPEVYVVYGQASFWIPSPEELFALGYSWADVQVVPDGAVAKLRRVPLDGTALHERTREGTYYVFFDGRRHRMPNADALRWVRGTTTGVGRVPLGGLAKFSEVVFDSAARTPPSVVYPPDNGADFFGAVYFAIATAGTKRLVARGRELRIIELRGWLREVGAGCNPVDPDWHYHLELDPVWTRQQGINPNHVLKVGNIIHEGHGYDRPTPSALSAAAIPAVNVELNGWPMLAAKKEWLPVPTRPDGWSGFQYGCVSDPDKQAVSWPFDPLNPTGSAGGPLRVGDYVRVVGSLVTDKPHAGSDKPEWKQAKEAWADGKAERDRDNPARWTEIHPPDTIVPVREGEPGWRRKEAQYWGVAVVAPRSWWGEVTERALDVVLPPPPWRPPGTTRLAVEERVGPETNRETIAEGNATLTGARVDVLSGGIRVRVKVRGKAFGPLGKFKAIYRVYWA